MNIIMTLWSALLLAFWTVTAIYGQGRSCITGDGDVQIYQTNSFGSVDNAGRVEICLGGVWGTIAADSITTPWSEKNAQVACIQAGFGGVLNVILQETISYAERSEPLSIPIHLSRVECDGSERSILNCSTSSVDLSTVTHLQDAYVVCRPRLVDYSDVHPSGEQSGDIRLFGDPRNGYGAVEIYSNRLGWLGICPDSSWTNSDAATICQDLGYASGTVTSPITAIENSTHRAPSGHLYAANCPPRAGDPRPLGVCSFQSEPTASACPLNQFAALKCNNVSEMSVRLLGGDDSREGIVEIAYNGRWGMLCDDGFTDTDAQSVCQGLGFGRDNAKMMSLSFLSKILSSESNLKPIWLTELPCDASDSSLESCIGEENIIGFTDCRFLDIAAVDCDDRPQPLSAGYIAIIVVITATVIAIVIILGCTFGKPYWDKRHKYGWYNTLTTPSDWCDCDCIPSRTVTTRPAPVHQLSISSPIIYRNLTDSSSNSVLNTTAANHTSPDRQPAAGSEPEPEPEPEADPVPEPSDPNLTQPPPPSYQVASNFPSRDLKADLPPPYPGPGGSGTTAPLPYTGASDAADPPPASHGYQLSTAAPDTGAWALLD